MRWLLGLLFVAAGANHFANPDFYVRIMPPYLPWHLELVYLSGAFEAALGALLLFPRRQRLAAWGLVALLVAVFPANVHMALHPEEFKRLPNLDAEIPAWALYARLPLQGLLIAWAYWFTRPDAPRTGPSTTARVMAFLTGRAGRCRNRES